MPDAFLNPFPNLFLDVTSSASLAGRVSLKDPPVSFPVLG